VIGAESPRGEWPKVQTDADRFRTLTDQLGEAREEIAALKAKVEELEREDEEEAYHDEWTWRHIRLLRGEQAMPELPVPRLEIRWRAIGTGTTRIADYGLVYRFYGDDELRFVPISSTRCSGGRPDTDDPTARDRALQGPFRDGVHILADMVALGLPGFVVSEYGESRQLALGPIEDLPPALRELVLAKQGGAP
jgi:hypothetical protein